MLSAFCKRLTVVGNCAIAAGGAAIARLELSDAICSEIVISILLVAQSAGREA
ncbi:hypothetical protein [Altericista sp. CCNU0014]|uniref:hypothetical protein n=1 Tax=Altericista sp. CCNU0014 TaxID=3082949 RepID=UPI00384B644E